MSTAEPSGGVLWTAGPTIDLSDRGFCYGDGVFETLRFFSNTAPLGRGGFWLLERHLDRLLRGLSALQLAWPDSAELSDLLSTAAAAAEAAGTDCVLRLFASAAPMRRGYRRPPQHPVLLRAELRRAPPWRSQPALPLLASLAPAPLPASTPAPGFKHMNRLGEVLGSISTEAETTAETLLRNHQDQLICASTSNLIFRAASGFATPVLASAGIAGTARAVLLASDELGLHEAVVTTTDATAMPCFWSINSVVGLRAHTLQKRMVGAELPPALAIAQAQLTQVLDASRLEHCRRPGDTGLLDRLEALGTFRERSDQAASWRRDFQACTPAEGSAPSTGVG